MAKDTLTEAQRLDAQATRELAELAAHLKRTRVEVVGPKWRNITENANFQVTSRKVKVDIYRDSKVTGSVTVDIARYLQAELEINTLSALLALQKAAFDEKKIIVQLKRQNYDPQKNSGALDPDAGFRSYDRQLFLRLHSRNPAADPRTSTGNHQLGIALDLDLGTNRAHFLSLAPIPEGGKDTPALQNKRRDLFRKENQIFDWLLDHASRFGFNWDEGPNIAEPWHWVYGHPPKPGGSVKPFKGEGPAVKQHPAIPVASRAKATEKSPTTPPAAAKEARRNGRTAGAARDAEQKTPRVEAMAAAVGAGVQVARKVEASRRGRQTTETAADVALAIFKAGSDLNGYDFVEGHWAPDNKAV